MAKIKLNPETTEWVPVDRDALKGADKAALEAMVAANRAAQEAREAFDARIIAKLRTTGRLPAGKVPFISHAFGRTTLAHDKVDGSLLVQDESAPRAKGGKGKGLIKL